MNEKLQISFADLIASACSTIGGAKSFVLAEIPDVARQLMLWSIIRYSICAFLGIILLVAYIFAEYFFAIFIAENYGSFLDGVMTWFFLGLIPRVFIICLMCELINIVWLKIIIAPKIWLIEYANDLRKSAK